MTDPIIHPKHPAPAHADVDIKDAEGRSLRGSHVAELGDNHDEDAPAINQTTAAGAKPGDTHVPFKGKMHRPDHKDDANPDVIDHELSAPIHNPVEPIPVHHPIVNKAPEKHIDNPHAEQNKEPVLSAPVHAPVTAPVVKHDKK